MNEPDHFQRLNALLDEALTLPAERRADFVARCESEQLRSELAALLALNEQPGPLDHPPHALAGEAVTQRRLGRYRLLEPLGEGGMATVWRAEHRDGEFAREVAVKCLKTGLATPNLRARFLREQQILAELEHPNIAHLYDVGISDDGVPFIVMELIDGDPMTEYCDRHRLSLRQRLTLFRQVLDAVACAHQNLIVHRDLKPANILVNDDGQPKLLDFGIAKALDETDEATRTQMRAMTPGYAAPEQFRGEAVTTATDVYALGVILHELLTGIRPQRDTDTDPASAPDPPPASQALRAAGLPGPRASRPQTQSGQDVRGPMRIEVARQRGFSDIDRLAQALRGDLDNLVAGSLRPEPTRRYRDAAALDAEIERYLLNLPLNVRRDSRAYRAAKFLRRNWLAAGAIGGIVLALTAGAAAALWQAGQARHEAERATAALEETEQALSRAEALQEFLLDLFRSAAPDRPRDQLPTTEEILALGAKQAMNGDSAPPTERLNMLVTIGSIYRQQNWNEQARPLLEAAVTLARQYRDERPEALASALWQLAVLVAGLQDLDQADRLLQEAESIVEVDESHWQKFIQIRAERGWVEFRKGNFAGAIRLSEPLYQQIRGHRDIPNAARRLLLNTLASALAEQGALAAAAEYATEFIELTRNSDSMGPESDSYAIALNNSVHLEYYLGRFEVALERSRQAVELIEQIENPERPSALRAAARSRLAHALLYAGHFDEALDYAEAANIERARFEGVLPDESEVRYYFLGYFLAMMHRWEEAEQALLKGHELFIRSGKEDRWSLLTVVDSLLAKALCRRGDLTQGESLLADLDTQLDGRYPEQPIYRSFVHEANSACLFQAGRPKPALSEVDTALELETGYPGRVMHQADRRILRARILAVLDRHDEAARELDLAEQAFLDLDLVDHPHFPNIDVARRELLATD